MQGANFENFGLFGAATAATLQRKFKLSIILCTTSFRRPLSFPKSWKTVVSASYPCVCGAKNSIPRATAGVLNTFSCYSGWRHSLADCFWNVVWLINLTIFSMHEVSRQFELIHQHLTGMHKSQPCVPLSGNNCVSARYGGKTEFR